MSDVALFMSDMLFMLLRHLLSTHSLIFFSLALATYTDHSKVVLIRSRSKTSTKSKMELSTL